METETWRVLLFLAATGVLYDALVSYVQEQLPDRHGVTSWLVVGGVLWTIFGIGILLGVRDMIVVMLCFMASGSPMIAGSMLRYWRERERVR